MKVDATRHTLLAWFVFASTSVSEFVKVPSSIVDYPELRLAGAEAIVGAGGYRGIAHSSPAAQIKNFRLSLDATFAPLNRSAYEALRERYAGWSATAPTTRWREGGADYTLLDFLPPALQATSGLHFHVQYHNYSLPSFTDGAKSRQAAQPALLASNCWGFAYAVMEAASKPATTSLTLSLASPHVAWDAFTSHGRFPLLQSTTTNPRLVGTDADDAVLRNAKLQPGDLMLIWHDNGGGQGLYLDHVAVYLDEDVYFERSGSGDHVPFRVNTWAGLAADWPTFVFVFEWRRRAKQYDPLPAAGDAFGLYQNSDELPLLAELSSEVATLFTLTPEYNASVPPKHVEKVTYVWIKELAEYAVDPDTGRASLPDEAFDAASLPIKVPDDIYKSSTVLV